MHQSIVAKKIDPKTSRKKVILDLVNTELDYDVEPKYRMLADQIRSGRYDCKKKALAAKNWDELDHYLLAMDHYRTIADDLGLAPAAVAARLYRLRREVRHQLLADELDGGGRHAA